jgi:hypothetical protein
VHIYPSVLQALVVRLCGMSGGVISRDTGVWLCRILDVNFREFLFHALG